MALSCPIDLDVSNGGRRQLADIVVSNELSDWIRRDIDLWSGRTAGALPEAALLDTLGAVGFVGVEPRRFDCFRGISKERIARKLGGDRNCHVHCETRITECQSGVPPVPALAQRQRSPTTKRLEAVP